MRPSDPPEPCNSAEELWTQLSPKDSAQETIYRGQADADDKLVPRVLRRQDGRPSFIGTYVTESMLTVEWQIIQEARLIECFVKHCDRIGLALPNDSIERRNKNLNRNGTDLDRFQKFPAQWPDNDWIELMALAQHHGVPTRLLDW